MSRYGGKGGKVAVIVREEEDLIEEDEWGR